MKLKNIEFTFEFLSKIITIIIIISLIPSLINMSTSPGLPILLTSGIFGILLGGLVLFLISEFFFE
jgi:hypothetical protein